MSFLGNFNYCMLTISMIDCFFFLKMILQCFRRKSDPTDRFNPTTFVCLPKSRPRFPSAPVIDISVFENFRFDRGVVCVDVFG